MKESRSGAQVSRFCQHHVYWPLGDPIALACQMCNPDGMPAGPAPVLPRSSGDVLNSNRTEKLDTCNTCGGLRTFSSPNCRACGTLFPVDDAAGRVQASANVHAQGSCPNCSSTIHYEVTKQKWSCADCDTIYPAPKRKAAR